MVLRLRSTTCLSVLALFAAMPCAARSQGPLPTPARQDSGFAQRAVPVFDLAARELRGEVQLWLPRGDVRFLDQVVGDRFLGTESAHDALRAFEAGLATVLELVDLESGTRHAWRIGPDTTHATRMERHARAVAHAPEVAHDRGFGRPNLTWLSTREVLLLGGRLPDEGRLVELHLDGTVVECSSAFDPHVGPTWWSSWNGELETFLGATWNVLLRWTISGGREVMASAGDVAAPHGWSADELQGKRIQQWFRGSTRPVGGTWLVVVETMADTPPPRGFLGSRGAPSGPWCFTLAELDAVTGSLVRRVRLDDESPFDLVYPRSERGTWRGPKSIGAVGWGSVGRTTVGLAWADGDTYRLEAVELESVNVRVPMGVVRCDSEPDGLMLCRVARAEGEEGFLLLRAP
jgi:hypothetical protein